MSTPSVSVIIGTYNAGKHLRQTLQSILDQTFTAYEIIVVDDASQDDTLDILQSYGDRLQVIRRATNSATCELPRYQGVKHARGKYCAFLDADDLWDPTFLEKAFTYLESHPDTPLVHAQVRVIDANQHVQRIRHEGAIPNTEWVARELLRHCFITISAVMVRREIWLEAIVEKTLTDFGMDLDFFLAIAKQYPVGFISETLASYRRSSASISVKNWKRIPRNVNTLERLWRTEAWQGVASRKEMRLILAEAYLENSEYWRAQGIPSRSIWFSLRGLKHRFRARCLWKGLIASMWETLFSHKQKNL